MRPCSMQDDVLGKGTRSTLTVCQVRSRLFGHAVVLVAAAALFAGLGAMIYFGVSTPPYSEPVELLEGVVRSDRFTTRWEADYRVRIDTERGMDARKQRCLLGLQPLSAGDCDNIPSRLLLQWRIDDGAEWVIEGTTRAGRAVKRGPGLGKILGHFHGVGGKVYRVTTTTLRSSPTLNEADPRLTIELAPDELKWTYVWIGLLSQIAAFLLLLAAVLSAIAISRSGADRE